MARKPYQGGVVMFDQKQLKVGDYVKLANDEGLDLPTEYQGKVGRIIVQVDEHNFDVMMQDGEVVHCAYYHLDPPIGGQVVQPCEQVSLRSNVETDYLDYEIARIVMIDPSTGYIVAIADDFNDALRFVEQQYGLSIEQQKYELSHIDVWGDNGKYCVNYIAQDAPGWSVAYAMWALSSLNYDVTELMNTFFTP